MSKLIVVTALGASLLLAGYPVEIVQASEHAVKTARINPHRRRRPIQAG